MLAYEAQQYSQYDKKAHQWMLEPSLCVPPEPNWRTRRAEMLRFIICSSSQTAANGMIRPIDLMAATIFPTLRGSCPKYSV